MIAALQPSGVDCQCVAVHNPRNVLLEWHHVWPREWGGPSVPENMVWLCASAHNTVHVYMRAMDSAGYALARSELRAALVARHYPDYLNAYTYGLAVTGFTRRQQGHL